MPQTPPETPLRTPEARLRALVHDTLGTEPERITLEVMEDRVRVTVPVRNYPVSGIGLLAQRTGRMYEVSETAATGTIDFIDNPERGENRMPERKSWPRLPVTWRGNPVRRNHRQPLLSASRSARRSSWS
jgi:hypothetical protein